VPGVLRRFRKALEGLGTGANEEACV